MNREEIENLIDTIELYLDQMRAIVPQVTEDSEFSDFNNALWDCSDALAVAANSIPRSIQ